MQSLSPPPQPNGNRPTAERIELWDLGRLLASAHNARTHGRKQIAAVAASIGTYGFIVLVLVAPDGSIIAGHGRVVAARKLGLPRVPVIVIGHLSEAERRAYAIADNRIALNAGWDEGLPQD